MHSDWLLKLRISFAIHLRVTRAEFTHHCRNKWDVFVSCFKEKNASFLHFDPSIYFPVFSVNSHLVPEPSITFLTSLVPRYKEAKDLQMYTVVRLLALQAVNNALAITKMLAYATTLVN